MSYKHIFGVPGLDHQKCAELGAFCCEESSPCSPEVLAKLPPETWISHPDAKADPAQQREGPVFEDILFVACPHCGMASALPKNLL
jgi:hypothetical protein